MPHTILETAKEAGTFETLLAAVDAAGLGDTLAGDGPFTVFAPTDDAFAALPPETMSGLLADPPALARILTYHVVPGRIMSAEITRDSEQTTVEGGVVRIAVNGAVTVNDATVVQPDIEADNGVIHVIDRVLIPAA
ncbi:MAG TPA: fasciclin domain-containing protein [Gaiellaceae bacterium]|nr:fasciclin domain-containing protein [Gaiellaceae bacterium]